jgi:hypothetical protein
MALQRRNDPAKWVAAHVKRYFEERGIIAPWEVGDVDKLAPLMAEPTSDESRMRWLRSSIKPMLERLKARYSLHELREAVGLLYDVAEYTRTKKSRERY